MEPPGNGNREEEDVLEDDEAQEGEIELVVQGRTIPVSERLLCEHSNYFKHIFREFDESQETIVLKHSHVAGQILPEDKQQEPLSLISFITMTTIVDFLYTGVLKIHEQNVKQLLYASDLLDMESVEAECFKYLTENLSVRNCVRRFVLASAKACWHELARHIRIFIVHHFDLLTRSSTIFKLLDVDQFKEILSSPNLSIQYEEQVYDAVMNWVLVDSENRRKSLPLLFEEIQWSLIRTPKYYEDTLKDPLVMDDQTCARIMAAAEDYFHLSYKEKLDYWKDRRRPSRWPKLLAALSYAEKLIECFDFEEENWFVLTEKPGYVFGSSMCYLNGKLYTIGGVQSKSVDQYDPEKDEWKDFFPSLRHCRVAHGVTVSNNQIFVTGGSAKANANFGPGLYEMEFVSLGPTGEVLHDWRIAGKMKEGRSFLGSAAVNGKIYNVGGCLSEDNSTAEVWDPLTGKFSDVSRCLGKRDSQAMAVVEGEIYSLGGYDNISNIYLSSCEKYSPNLDSWQSIPAMNVARRSPGVANYRDRLFVVGGMGEESDLSSVEIFTPSTQEWRLLPQSMKQVNGWCSVCLIDKPLRLMTEPRTYSKFSAGLNGLISVGGLDPDCWETDSAGSRRESIASTASGCGSGGATTGGTPTDKIHMEWKTTENARTEQRMKHRKEFQST